MTTTPIIATDAHLDAAFADQPDPATDAEAAEAAQKAETRVSASAKRAAEKAAAKVYEKKAAGPVVPNAAAKQRAVAANLLPDAAMYQVQKRKGPDDPNPGKLTYDHRYTQEEFQKFGDPRAFIKHFLVPKYGGGEYEVTPTSAAGVVGATITYDLGDDDDMGQNGAVQADLREIKTKLGEKKESKLEDMAVRMAERALDGGDDDAPMTMDKVMTYRLMQDMLTPKGPDPAVMALLAKLEAKLDAPPPMPMMPSAPAVDPNAVTQRDLYAMQDKAAERAEKMYERMEAARRDDARRTDERFDKVLDAIKSTQKNGDPLERALAQYKTIQALKEEEGGGGASKALGELAKTARLIWTDMNAMKAAGTAPGQPGQPQQQLPAPAQPQVPPEILAQIAKMGAAATNEDRVTSSYDLAQMLAVFPEFADEFNGFIREIVAVAEANAAKNAEATLTAKTALRARLTDFYNGLTQRGAIPNTAVPVFMAAWEAEGDRLCEFVRMQLRAQTVAPPQSATSPVPGTATVQK